MPALLKILVPFSIGFFYESQSKCMKSHFPSKKMSKSQFPFYPFRTLKLVCLLHLIICIKISQFCWPCSAVLGKYNAEKEISWSANFLFFKICTKIIFVRKGRVLVLIFLRCFTKHSDWKDSLFMLNFFMCIITKYNSYNSMISRAI